MKKENLYRGFFYVLGMLILALGLMLNVKTGLGVSTLLGSAYCISEYTGISFGNMSFVWYVIFVVIQMGIHKSMKKEKTMFILDALQLPTSLVFTRVLDLYGLLIPNAANSSMVIRLVMMAFAVAFTGIGGAMSMNMRLVPNPGDGLVQSISDKIGKPVGLCKNMADATCVAITFVLSMILFHHPVGIGIATLCAMCFTGRCIAVFNHFTMKTLLNLAGVKR